MSNMVSPTVTWMEAPSYHAAAFDHREPVGRRTPFDPMTRRTPLSKKRRGFQPDQPATGESPSEQPAEPAAAPSRRTSRASSRRRSRAKPEAEPRSALERYRGVVIGALAVLAVGFVGLMLFQGASAARYECGSLLTPPPVAIDEQPGFATQDLGRTHQATGSTVVFEFCPPTSGEHWSDASRSPLRRAFYGPGDSVSPGNWVHNLEHGYVIFAYQRYTAESEQADIREAMDSAPAGELAEACGLPNKVMAVPFDEMDEPFAALAWDRALLMPEWDTEAAIAFAEAWQDSPQAPERAC